MFEYKIAFQRNTEHTHTSTLGCTLAQYSSIISDKDYGKNLAVNIAY